MDTQPRPTITSLSQAEIAELTAFLHRLADAAAAVTLQHFRVQLAVEDKSHGMADTVFGFDPVTIADRDAEKAIRQLIEKHYPRHGILGEEYGLTREDARLRWIIDPIDGTRAFVAGVPTWGTLIGLYLDGRPLIGLMDQPFIGERFWGGPDGSFYRHGQTERPLQTRACKSLDRAIFSTTSPDYFEKGREMTGFQALKSSTQLVRFGCDCYAYSLLAMGQLDIVAECGLKPFDIAALVPIVEGAGGRMTTWDGDSAADGGQILATGDPDLHAEALALLR